MDYINTSHPGFIGGSKAVEMALQQQRGVKVLPSNTKTKVCMEPLLDGPHTLVAMPFLWGLWHA